MDHSGPLEVWRGGVNAWECDEMGHMNVRFYLARAQEGLAGLALALGQPHAFSASATATLIVRAQHVRFLREARVGAPLYMTGAVVELGESDARLLQVLVHASSGEPCASFLTDVQHATPHDGRAFPWPERARQAAERLSGPVPAFAEPRGLAAAPGGEASLARADALGLACIGRGAVVAEACDIFGRMSPERFIARISDGVGALLSPLRQALGEAGAAKRIGGAALEYRLSYAQLPRAGDHVELRAGVAALDEKVQRLVHWLLDPVSGRAWATAQAVVASFDLDARRILPLPDELRARLARNVTPGLLD